ncbi:hypothetical protein [Marinomonas transparens]|uniref:Uncharacterized protein n=1 Tax=Marinomonas transparens TaxID=2795388 RepID=A0A934N4E3_9GAMM|nr:hypothetical protein [Marinomonas transparens]MBJ7539993.1 hypothetical protein [Marinomonas transparens]
MNYLPPLRNYQQMVRVVQNDTDGDHLAKHAVNFSLGNAFGDEQTSEFDHLFSNGGVSPTELQMRTLDSMNLPSSSPRRPGATNHGGLYSTRAGSSLFHSLNHSTRDYLNGTGQQVASRHHNGPGTKFRTELSPHADNKIIYKRTHVSQSNDHRPMALQLPNHKHNEPHHDFPSQQHAEPPHSGHSRL